MERRFGRMVSFLALISMGSVALANPPQIAPAEPNRQLTKVPVTLVIPPALRERLSAAQLQQIETLVRDQLFVWGNFEVTLPPEVVPTGAQAIDLSPLFLVDAAGHVRRMAYRADGERRELTPEQWEQLRHESLFKVEDPQNPGNYDVWKITSSLAHKGTQEIRITMHEHLANGVGHITVELPKAIVGTGWLSVRRGFTNIAYGLRNTFSLLIGWPETRPRFTQLEIDALVAKERARRVRDGIDGINGGDPAVATGDTRLGNEKLMEKALPILQAIGKASEQVWSSLYQHHRERIEQDMAAAGMPRNERPQHLADQLEVAKQELFFQHVVGNVELERLSPGLGILIANHGRGISIIRREEARLSAEILAWRDSMRQALASEHPVLSKTEGWLDRNTEELTQERYDEIRHERYTAIVDKLLREGLKQEAAALKAALHSFENYEEEEAKELAAQTQAARVFKHYRRIWQPKNWIIQSREVAPGEVNYFAQRNKPLPLLADVYTTTPGWRLLNLGAHTARVASEVLYQVLYKNWINGPVGIRSLIEEDAFPTIFLVDPETGRLVAQTERDGKSLLTGTLSSRLDEIEKSVQAALKKVAESPDEHWIAKKYWEPALNFWHGIVRRYGAPPALFLLQTGTFLVNSAATGAIVATTPVWAPMGGLIALGFNATSYDTHNPRNYLPPRRRNPNPLDAQTSTVMPLAMEVLRVAKDGFFYGSVAAVKALLWDLPLAGGSIAVGYVRALAELGRDAVARGIAYALGGKRIPALDPSFFIRRTSGVGVSGGYFLEATPEAAMTATLIQLELLELREFVATNVTTIYQPRVAAREVLAPYSVLTNGSDELDFGPESPLGKVFSKAEQKNVEKLNKAVNARIQELHKLLPVNEAPIKMSQEQLDRSLAESAKLAELYVTRRVLRGKSATEVDAFWTRQNLTRGDWAGLSKRMLAASFGAEVLTSIQETDETFRVDVVTPGLGDRIRDVLTGNNLNLDPIPAPDWTRVNLDGVSPLVRALNGSNVCAAGLAAYGGGMRRRASEMAPPNND